MTEKTTPPTTPKLRLMTPYVTIWAGLASLSLVYLGLLALEPTLVTEYLGTRRADPQMTEQSAETTRALDEALAGVHTLKSSIEQVQSDLSALKSEVSAQADRDREVMERIAALETVPQPGGKTVKVATVPPAAQKNAQPAQAPAAPAKKPVATATPVKAPATAGAGLETGSVAGPAAAATGVTFGPAVVTPTAATPAPATAPAKTVGIQVATGPSVDSLRLSWSLLAERHGTKLGSLQPRYTIGADEQGVAYNLVAGPVSSLAEAKQICQELAAKATPCAPTQFRGDAL